MKLFKMSDKAYDIMKWIALVLLPAVAVLYGALAPVWGWGNSDKVVYTLTAIDTFLGAILGISTVQYNKEQE